jgi:hypothetical protein
MEQLLA